MSLSLRRLRAQEGSLPLALLAAIVVAGLVAVLTARVIAGERVSRFDRSFTETLHVADGGLNQALFWFNSETTDYEDTVAIGGAGPSNTDTIDGIPYEWSTTRTGPRTWDLVSQSVAGDDTRRTVVATLEEVPRFFPGAFGDTLIAFNGTSSKVDSYDPGCDTFTADCRWGSTTGNDYAKAFGTGNGSFGTNEVLDLSGNVDVRADGAFLYDCANPNNQCVPVDQQFGNRCIGTTRCTEFYVERQDRKLDFASAPRTRFITSKFAATTGACHPDNNTAASNRWIPNQSDGSNDAVARLGAKNSITPATLSPYDTSSTNDNPFADNFDNFYCAESLEFLGNVQITGADADTPVVIFVKDFVKIPNSGTNVGCYNAAGSGCPGQDSQERDVRPFATNLQIYVAGEGTSDVFYKSQVRFGGVMYAPLSRCGGDGGAGADVYGLMMCGTMDNVGNWDFHFDDTLGNFGIGRFNVAFWDEDPSASP